MNARRMELALRKEEVGLHRAHEQLKRSSSEMLRLDAACLTHARNHEFLLSYGERSLGSPEGDRAFEQTLRSISALVAGRGQLEALRHEFVLHNQSNADTYRAGRIRVERLTGRIKANQCRLGAAREILELESE